MRRTYTVTWGDLAALWVFLLVMGAMLLGRVLTLPPTTPPITHTHAGLDACVQDSSVMVPELWLIETRAQRDSALAAAIAWRDSTTKYRGRAW
jgi:hypothetical protein